MIRKMQPLEYNEILLPWFAGYDWSPVPRESLPSSCFFLFKEDKPLAFSSYYISDSNMVILGYTIKNPYLRVTNKDIETLLAHTIDDIKIRGYKYIHYSTGRNGVSIVRILKKLGMNVTCDAGYILGMSCENKPIDFLEE